jgi:phosphate starvation-inducible PhoH-like protein
LLAAPYSKKLNIWNSAERLMLFGLNEVHIDIIEKETQVKILTRNEDIVLSGAADEVERIGHMLEVLLTLIKKGYLLGEKDIYYAIELAQKDLTNELLELFDKKIITTYNGKEIMAKSIGQKHYLNTINEKDIVFGIGPAGTGKTFLSVVLAVLALKQGEIKKIVLTRPAIEAGESLGFLPGDMQEKVDPYLRPIYDSLYDLLGVEHVNRYLERGLIEIAPLAYMRGRTLNNAFVILDEAQNTTMEQMKMFLTRLGNGSKMVVNGDITQIDLPKGKESGLIHAIKVLEDIPEIGFVYLTEVDVVRHSLVRKIIKAYGRKENR